MNEKPNEQFRPSAEKIESAEFIEDKENFENQKVLVIGGPDAHGVSTAVASAKYLEQRGAEAVIYVGSPVIREGKGATHPGAFYTKTIPMLDVGGFDRVVISDIPLDFRNLENSEKAIMQLNERVREDRKKRGLLDIEHSTFYLDHHSTTKFSTPSESAVIKNVSTAEACRLGHEKMTLVRIGAICDRDAATLPVTDEEMFLAKGLDAAVRPDPDEERPKLSKEATEEEKESYQGRLKAWEDRAQKRLEETVRQLKNENWEYFKKEAERLSRIEIPTSSGFGQVAIVDTQDLTAKFGVLKLMEMAIENAGVEKTPYALGVLREMGDIKMSREPSDVLTVIRHWTREDLPSVDKIITERFGKEFVEKYKMYGAENAKTIRLPVNDRETAKIAAELVETFAGREMPDFSQVKSVVMCGDPNSGKSVYSTIFREALKTLGVKVDHLDLDKAAPTPQWFLDAEIGYKETEFLFSQNKASQEQLDKAKKKLDEVAERRRAMKRPWSIDLAEEAKQELVSAGQKEDTDFIIGDIGGGRIKKDESGKIVKITRLTAENARILEGTDAVIIVSNNPQGAAEWKKLIEAGVDPETGVRINRDKPIQIVGIYQSILEGSVQETATGEKTGTVTNLDRSKAEKKYNPTIFTTAMFVSEAVENKQAYQKFEEQSLSNLEKMSRTSKGVSDTSSSEQKPGLTKEGEDLAQRTLVNFKAALEIVWRRKKDVFNTTDQVKQFIEDISGVVSRGLLAEDQSLFRTWETKFNQTPPSQIQTAMLGFYQELTEKLNDEKTDPVQLAAWIEKNFDSEIHPLADGCGRAAKVLSGFVLTRSNQSLPNYRNRDEYYREITKSLDQWEQYYRSLF